jgi:Icc-related predicted phosphoesterase
MRLVIISDTHNEHNKVKLPDGDLLIFGGDMSDYGSIEEIENFISWFKSQPHEYKVIIAGNHDFAMEGSMSSMLINDIRDEKTFYLDQQTVEIEGLTIFGSPYTPKYGYWAFMRERGPEMEYIWSAIPDKVDIVITHGPLYGYLDSFIVEGNNVFTGCKALRARLANVDFKLHICGHIHEAYGYMHLNREKHYVNAAICNRHNVATNKPIVMDYDGINFEKVEVHTRKFDDEGNLL